MFDQLPASWQDLLDRISPTRLKSLEEKVTFARQNGNVYPPAGKQFNAFNLSPEDVRVVILGQDPYHGDGQAMGLSFSVPEGVKPPPSLLNIFKEIEQEGGRPAAGRTGDLTAWSKQGVLLLNSVLTVDAGQAASHRGLGWELLTDAAIKTLSKRDNPIVFMLWGKDAIAKRSLIDEGKHLVLVSVHPSPLSAYRGFFGNDHFKKANEFMILHGYPPIEW